ncbi:uncharacterized protein LOC133174061 [Saccostrea echinata]|uniref:uncharacterized protein LOC133174061 n=1 Tax=Saccostrea echinata TaxID=191078 RepID=UPI002A7F24F8|nr:uncharacterized protein LOC133174061 [Saccostrea echinata]
MEEKPLKSIVYIYTDCQTVASDILFLLDASGSIGEHVYHTQIIPFVQDFISKPTLRFGPSNTQVGVMAFADGQHSDLPLKNFQTKIELITEIQTYMSFRGGATDTHNALTHVREHMFTKEKGDRPGAEDVLVIMTDGGSSIPEETVKEIYNNSQKDFFCGSVFIFINSLKRQNVTIYVVPVGNCKFYWNEIYSMATSSHHVITDLNHIDTFTAAQLLWRWICRAATTFSTFTSLTSRRPHNPVFIPLFPTAPTTISPKTTNPQHVFFTANIIHPSHLPCVDADPDCPTYPPDVCTADKDWARSSCRKTCVLCEVPTTISPMPTTTPKPTSTTSKATTTTPKPTTTTPKPTTTTPTTTTPKPTTTTPKPTTTTPKPTTTNPKPTTTTPKPLTITPKPSTTAPKPHFQTATCDDQDPFCSTYSLAICTTNPVWASGSCRKTCGLCHSKPTTKPTTTTSKPTTAKATPQRHHYVTIRSIVGEKGGGILNIKI